MDRFRMCFEGEQIGFADGFEVGREEIERATDSAYVISLSYQCAVLSGCSQKLREESVLRRK